MGLFCRIPTVLPATSYGYTPPPPEATARLAVPRPRVWHRGRDPAPPLAVRLHELRRIGRSRLRRAVGAPGARAVAALRARRQAGSSTWATAQRRQRARSGRSTITAPSRRRTCRARARDQTRRIPSQPGSGQLSRSASSAWRAASGSTTVITQARSRQHSRSLPSEPLRGEGGTRVAASHAPPRSRQPLSPTVPGHRRGQAAHGFTATHATRPATARSMHTRGVAHQRPDPGSRPAADLGSRRRARPRSTWRSTGAGRGAKSSHCPHTMPPTSAAATNDRPAGYLGSSDVCDMNNPAGWRAVAGHDSKHACLDRTITDPATGWSESPPDATASATCSTDISRPHEPHRVSGTHATGPSSRRPARPSQHSDRAADLGYERLPVLDRRS